MRAARVLVALTMLLPLCQVGQAQSAPANQTPSDQKTMDDIYGFIPGYDKAKSMGKALSGIFGPATPDNSGGVYEDPQCHFWETKAACSKKWGADIGIDDGSSSLNSPTPTPSPSPIVTSRPGSATAGSSRPASYEKYGCAGRQSEFAAGQKAALTKSATCDAAKQKVATMSNYANYFYFCMSQDPSRYDYEYGRYEEAVSEQTYLCEGPPSNGLTRTGVPDTSDSPGTTGKGSPALQQMMGDQAAQEKAEAQRKAQALAEQQAAQRAAQQAAWQRAEQQRIQQQAAAQQEETTRRQADADVENADDAQSENFNSLMGTMIQGRGRSSAPSAGNSGFRPPSAPPQPSSSMRPCVPSRDNCGCTCAK